MKSLHTRRLAADPRRRGMALLLSFLLLLVLVAIMHQLRLATATEARVSRNEVALTSMDLAIESVLLEMYERLLEDAEAASAGGAGGGGAAGAGAEAPPGSDPLEGSGEESEATDSRKDEWAQAYRRGAMTIGDIDLRILIQDEDSKINVLGMLTEDEEEAEKVFERVKRVLETFRADTDEELDRSQAENLARTMRDFLLQRRSWEDDLPVPDLVTNDEDDLDRGMILDLRDLVALEGFYPGLFRDYRTPEGVIVHSLASYLTCWSSMTTADRLAREGAEDPPEPESEPEPEPESESDGGEDSESGGPAEGEGDDEDAAGSDEAGVAVNLNTAPPVVLKALMDDRDVNPRFWDDVIEYRNLEEEVEDDEEEAEPIYDEFGEEIIDRQIFDTLDELGEVDGWLDLDVEMRTELERLLTLQSNVFTIFVTARRKTARSEFDPLQARNHDEARRLEDEQASLSRTVRSVVWRREAEDGWEIVPIVRWEVLDYSPYEVVDYPGEDR